MTAGCAECAVARGESRPLGLPPLARGAYLVHPRHEPGAYAGWMLVAPRRHVEQVAELSEEEAHQLGSLLRETAAALAAETACAKTYVACFAEVVPHLHFHVVARAPEAAEATRGAQAFLAPAAAADLPARAALAQRVMARMEHKGSRWRPLLLSALLWPGAGQIVAGRRRFGWTVAMATGAGFLLLMRALVVETLLRMPTDGVVFDDFGSLLALSQRLAGEIRPVLSPYLWALVGLWLLGCVEAAARVAREPA